MKNIGVPAGEGGISLVIEEGKYPEGRSFINSTTGEMETGGARRTLKIEHEQGVGDVKFFHYGQGQFSAAGLKYIKTEPLGACVGLTLWHSRLKIGIVAHFVITNNAAKGINSIFDEIKSTGTDPSEFEARLFGGGAADHGDNKPGSQRLIKDINEGLVREDVSLLELEVDLYGASARCVALKLENGEVYDYPYDTASISKNDHPIENKRLPVNSLPPLPVYN